MKRRRYTRADRVDQIARYYYKKTGRGITYVHLMKEGIAQHKRQAQNTLKRFLLMGIIFTIESRRPQEYYPMSIKSQIMQGILKKNTPIQPTGDNSKSHRSRISIENIVNQSLLDYVLPLLPTAPLYIHNLHLKMKINPENYSDLSIPLNKNNNGRYVEDTIGNFLVRFTIYKNGTTEIYISSSKHPFKLDTDLDLGRLLVYLGQIKQCLLQLLLDPHERIVPDIMEWEVTECDVNKDIPVSDTFHLTGFKIQVYSGNCNTTNLDSKGLIILVLLFAVAKTRMSIFNDRVLAILVSESRPVSIKFSKDVWSALFILSSSSTKRYSGNFSNI